MIDFANINDGKYKHTNHPIAAFVLPILLYSRQLMYTKLYVFVYRHLKVYILSIRCWVFSIKDCEN